MFKLYRVPGGLRPPRTPPPRRRIALPYNRPGPIECQLIDRGGLWLNGGYGNGTNRGAGQPRGPQVPSAPAALPLPLPRP